MVKTYLSITLKKVHYITIYYIDIFKSPEEISISKYPHILFIMLFENLDFKKRRNIIYIPANHITTSK